MQPDTPHDPSTTLERLYVLIRRGLATNHIAAAAPPVADAVERLYERLDAEATATGTPAYQHIETSMALITSPSSRATGGTPAVSPLGRPAFRSVSVAVPRWPRDLISTVAATALGIGAVALVLTHRHATSVTSVASWRTYTTRVGERATVTLADGTRVTLAPQTTLRVASKFGVHRRAVSLDGEAYFDVRSNPTVPFSVHAGTIAARVLGTTFVMRRYHGDSAALVAVTNGKVAVTSSLSSRAPLTLTAGVVGLASDSTTVVVPGDSAKRHMAWTSGQLEFTDTPMPEVLATLSRWYGYHFRLADSALAEHTVTAILDTRSSAYAFRTLKLVLNVDLTFDGDTVTLYPHKGLTSRGRSRRGASEPLPLPHREVGR